MTIIRTIHFSSLSPCPRCIHFPRVGLALVQCRASRSNTNQGQNKSLSSYPWRGCRNCLERTQREAKRGCVFLCKVSLSLKLPTFLQTIALQLLQIVMVTKRLLRLYSFQSAFFSPFHYSVTDVKIHRKSAILGGGTFSSGGNVSAKVFIFR